MKLTKFLTVFFILLYSSLLLIYSANEETIRFLVRLTARISALLFFLSFSASALNFILKNKLSKGLLRNRREFGISFAISHLIHLVFIILYANMNPDRFFATSAWLIFIFGGTTYLFIIAMLFTSFDFFKKKLSKKAWKSLHTIGSYFILLVFLNSFTGRASTDIFYFLSTLLLFFLLFLRLFYQFRKKH